MQIPIPIYKMSKVDIDVGKANKQSESYLKVERV